MPLSAATKAAHRAAKTAGVKQREAQRRLAIHQQFQAERSHPLLWLGPAEQKAAARKLMEAAAAAAPQMSDPPAAASANAAHAADSTPGAPHTQASDSSHMKRKASEQAADASLKRHAQRNLLPALAAYPGNTDAAAQLAALAYSEADDDDLNNAHFDDEAQAEVGGQHTWCAMNGGPPDHMYSCRCVRVCCACVFWCSAGFDAWGPHPPLPLLHLHLHLHLAPRVARVCLPSLRLCRIRIRVRALATRPGAQLDCRAAAATAARRRRQNNHSFSAEGHNTSCSLLQRCC